MDILTECVTLGFDSIILLCCLREYYKSKFTIDLLKDAQVVTDGNSAKKLINENPDEKVPYVVVRGVVKAQGEPIISCNNPRAKGVIQSITLMEHIVSKGAGGFWSDSERTVKQSHNIIPFGLNLNGKIVEVCDPLSSDYLDLEIISDQFLPTKQSLMDHIVGFFYGYRKRGIQTTERMLREGTTLTGVGELISHADGSLMLQPPTDTNSPYILSPLPMPQLIRKVQGRQKRFGWLVVLFGVVGGVIAGLIVRKYWKYKKHMKEQYERQNELDKTRKERRRLIRDPAAELPESQICVVCKTNPIEIILLPCGHVCLCEDCVEGITKDCPVCRNPILSKSPAYIP